MHIFEKIFHLFYFYSLQNLLYFVYEAINYLNSSLGTDTCVYFNNKKIQCIGGNYNISNGVNTCYTLHNAQIDKIYSMGNV